ncbi:MAG: LEA type 2 family protein [Thermoanaerobaculia bacterium]
MKTVALSLLVSLGVATLPARGETVATGSIERIEVTSLTRERITLVAHALLTQVAAGTKQSFVGEVAVANVAIPVTTPVWVAVRPVKGTNEAKVYISLELGKVPEALLARAGTRALDLSLKGFLKGERGSSAPVCAIGLMRYGTQEVFAPATLGNAFFSFLGARLTGMTLSETSGEATVVLYNPFSFAIPLRRITYSLEAEDRKLGSGEVPATRIRPKQENKILVPISVGNGDLIAVAGGAVMGGGDIEGRLVAKLSFKIGADEITLPISLPGKIQVSR